MDDFKEFDEFEGGFSIQDMMEDTGMTRSGVDTWIRRNGHRPFRIEGGRNFYDHHVLSELLIHREAKPPKHPPKSKTSMTSSTSEELEKRITFLEQKVKQILDVLELPEVVESP